MYKAVRYQRTIRWGFLPCMEIGAGLIGQAVENASTAQPHLGTTHLPSDMLMHRASDTTSVMQAVAINLGAQKTPEAVA